MSNNNDAIFFLPVGDMKLARNGAFSNKEVKKIVLDPEWKEMVPGHYKKKKKSLFALFGQ